MNGLVARQKLVDGACKEKHNPGPSRVIGDIGHSPRFSPIGDFHRIIVFFAAIKLAIESSTAVCSEMEELCSVG